jgi:hypothetical protein
VVTCRPGSSPGKSANEYRTLPLEDVLAATLLTGRGRSQKRVSTNSPLDPQDVGSGGIPAQSVFSVWAQRLPTCGLFSEWHAVWSPDGPQGSRPIRVVDAQVSSGLGSG